MADGARSTGVQATLPVATPADELGVFVSWGAALFYWAECDANPKVRSYWDALHYVSTALSVGYANIFPVTGLGKALAAAIMTVGPSLSARALDQAPRGNEAGASTALIAGKLDAILEELRRLNATEDAPKSK